MNKMPKKTIKGVIHFHSNYSYDGHDSIQDIVAFLRNRGGSFVFLTEHDDDFTELKMERFVEDCEAASSEDFLVVPGIEFRCCNKVHILGLGLREFFIENEPLKVVRQIKRAGGKAIIAHPRQYLKNITDDLIRLVHGVEVWNGCNDGKLFPRSSIVYAFSNWKSINGLLIPIFGADHHDIRKYFPIETKVDVEALDFETIWDGLTKAQYSVTGTLFRFKTANLEGRTNFLVVGEWLLRVYKAARECFFRTRLRREGNQDGSVGR